jgi:hypothetical protein
MRTKCSNLLVRDLAKAQRYAQLANEYFPGMNFGVIGITEDNEPAPERTQFLGYDIGRLESLIILSALPLISEDDEEDPANVSHNIIKRQFRPKLNEFVLFRTCKDAADCRRAMIALQNLSPNSYEGGDIESFKRKFEVTPVFLIEPPPLH